MSESQAPASTARLYNSAINSLLFQRNITTHRKAWKQEEAGSGFGLVTKQESWEIQHCDWIVVWSRMFFSITVIALGIWIIHKSPNQLFKLKTRYVNSNLQPRLFLKYVTFIRFIFIRLHTAMCHCSATEGPNGVWTESGCFYLTCGFLAQNIPPCYN